MGHAPSQHDDHLHDHNIDYDRAEYAELCSLTTLQSASSWSNTRPGLPFPVLTLSVPVLWQRVHSVKVNIPLVE